LVADGIADWRRTLSDLLTDHAWRRERAEQSRKIAFDLYGLGATGRRYDDLFSSLL
jgi:hypothetical protein